MMQAYLQMFKCLCGRRLEGLCQNNDLHWSGAISEVCVRDNLALWHTVSHDVIASFVYLRHVLCPFLGGLTVHKGTWKSASVFTITVQLKSHKKLCLNRNSCILFEITCLGPMWSLQVFRMFWKISRLSLFHITRNLVVKKPCSKTHMKSAILAWRTHPLSHLSGCYQIWTTYRCVKTFLFLSSLVGGMEDGSQIDASSWHRKNSNPSAPHGQSLCACLMYVCII